LYDSVALLADTEWSSVSERATFSVGFVWWAGWLVREMAGERETFSVGCGVVGEMAGGREPFLVGCGVVGEMAGERETFSVGCCVVGEMAGERETFSVGCCVVGEMAGERETFLRAVVWWARWLVSEKLSRWAFCM
jgi:hypothetical protein